MSKTTIPVLAILGLVAIHGIIATEETQTEVFGGDKFDSSASSLSPADDSGNPLSGRFARSFVTLNRDEDHSNVDLDRINTYRYDMLAPSGDDSIPTMMYNRELQRNQNKFLRALTGMKRNEAGGAPFRVKEDKDYTFVALPVSNRRPNGQDFASRARLLASELLRDALMDHQNGPQLKR